MNPMTYLLVICAFAHTGLALKCWDCNYDMTNPNADPSLECLKGANDFFGPGENKTKPAGLSLKTCRGGEACAKLKMSMQHPLTGQSLNVVSRSCMPDVAHVGNTCVNQEIAVPGQQPMKTEMCVCNSDECNAAPISSQASLFGLILPIVVKMVAF